MNEEEKLGCSEILNKLQDDELFSVTDTVTKKLITVSSKSEAISATITYSSSAYELLTRRKIKRDVLFKYLVEKGIVFSVNSDKKKLIEKILETWGTKNIQDLMKDYDSGLASSSSSSLDSYSPDTSSTSTNGTGLAISEITDRNENKVFQETGTPDLQLLGETFAKWFYKVLNSNNPQMNVTPEEFGPCHFWDEAKLQLTILSQDQSTQDVLEGSQLVSERILSFAKSECLLFNPNISKDGVFVQTQRHGLVMVLVCGTIHRENQHLGVFDQVFGLVKDPRYNDNYKIKLTKLKLLNVEVDHTPSLRDRPESEIYDLVSV